MLTKLLRQRMKKLKKFILHSQKNFREKLTKMIKLKKVEPFNLIKNENITLLNYTRIVSTFSFLVGNRVIQLSFNKKIKK